MAYESPYTGTQVDSAVGEVLGKEYQGISLTEKTDLAVTGAAQTIDLDYSLGNEQYLTCTTNDAFTLTNSNWPSAGGSMVLFVDSNNASGVGAPTWDATAFPSASSVNTPPDMAGITAGATGYGVYLVKYINGKWFFKTIEEG